MFYDVYIPRCAHIKTNGTQCGSPALREQRLCFFHKKWKSQQITLKAGQPAELQVVNMPLLEDADSVQVALMQVIRLVLTRQLDPKVSGLLLYALQTASLNLRQMQLQPRRLETVVIDPDQVGNTGVGADAWDKNQFRTEEAEAETAE